MPEFTTARYGWIPDEHDERDLKFSPPETAALPAHVDLSRLLPAAWNQGELGSCTSFGVAGAVAAARAKQGESYFEPSHLFIYYNERVVENTVTEDAGAQVRDGIKVVAKLGTPPESAWPYTDKGDRWRTRPDTQAYGQAVTHKALKYERVEHGHLRSALAAGWPVVFGFTVYESFESEQVATTGIVPMPSAGDSPVGGHCVLACGYDDATKRVLVRNSWGTGWGQHGYFEMPYDYVNDAQLASDFWTVTLEQ